MAEAVEAAAVPAVYDRETGVARALQGPFAWIAAALCAVLSAYGLYWTQFAINTTSYRATFLGLVLAIAFLIYPWMPGLKGRRGVHPLDLVLIAGAIVAVLYLVTHLEETKTRSTAPAEIEVWLGGLLILLVLEATRRATGRALPLIAAVFLVYGYFGRHMPAPFNHRGFSIERIVGQNFLTLEGLFSTPLDVAATFIVLFTLYGAVLDKGGAGRFYIDWAFALFGRRPSPAAPGRAVVASGLLLGSVSGSGIATTVTLASLAWPMLKRSGYTPAVAGGLLAASGIGATLSPPTLGAAAFIIAEYLDITYLDVLVMAAIPTLLYYLSCWLMIEADARRLRVVPVRTSDLSLGALTRAHGYHFISLFAIAVLLSLGMSAFLAVYWSIVIAVALSLIRAEDRLLTLSGAGLGLIGASVLVIIGERLSVAVFGGLAAAVGLGFAQAAVARLRTATPDPAPARFFAALAGGGRDCVGVAVTCACAGIIVSIVNLTGLGLKLSGVIVEWGAGSPFVTVTLAAVAMWVLGTAVPVTASYIIAAVILVPALVSVGIAAPAAHMFMFYYAVLADVSPPTALAPFAASAICGGTPLRTMMQAWKYTLPAFVVPFMFCLGPDGSGLLLAGSWESVVVGTAISGLALSGFAIAAAGWIIGPAGLIERLLAAAGGGLLIAGGLNGVAGGAGLIVAALILHGWRRARVVETG